MTWVLNPNRSKVEILSLYRDKVSYALLYRSSSWTCLRQAGSNRPEWSQNVRWTFCARGQTAALACRWVRVQQYQNEKIRSKTGFWL